MTKTKILPLAIATLAITTSLTGCVDCVDDNDIVITDSVVSETTTSHVTEMHYISYDYNVPELETDFKSWTNYKRSVNRNSKQWEILESNGAWTDLNGFRRYGEDYMVAMGTYYVNSLGDRFRITTERNSFTVMICDIKDDKHTDVNNQYTIANNCIVEFYTDDTLCNEVRHSGNCSTIQELSGKIIKIEKI